MQVGAHMTDEKLRADLRVDAKRAYEMLIGHEPDMSTEEILRTLADFCNEMADMERQYGE